MALTQTLAAALTAGMLGGCGGLAVGSSGGVDAAADGFARGVDGALDASSDATRGGRGDGNPTDAGGGPCAAGWLRCEGVCVDPSRDPANCGGCGRVCDGSCAEGHCVSEIASLNCPIDYGLAVDSTYAYWTANADSAPCQGVVRAPLVGGPQVSLSQYPPAVPTAGGAFALAIDATAAYYTASAQILSVPLVGGRPTTLVADGTHPTSLAIAVDAQNVYWVRPTGEMMRVPKVGGLPVTLATGAEDLPGIASDGTSVYWMGPKGVTKTALTDGHSTLLAESPSIETDGSAPAGVKLALHGESIYWLGPRGIRSVPTGGGTVTTIVGDASEPVVYLENNPFAVDGTRVYWGTRALMAAPIVGGAPVTLLDPLPGGRDVRAAVMALNANTLCWAEVHTRFEGPNLVETLSLK